MLHKTQNSTVEDVKESKKMQNLEKLSAMELKNIQEELIRQREIMSEKLRRRTEINKKMAEEKKYAYKTIQKEGNNLIDNCNNLRMKSKGVMMMIGLLNQEGTKMIDEIEQNLNKNKKYQKMESSNRVKRENTMKEIKKIDNSSYKSELPLHHYQRLKKNAPHRNVRIKGQQGLQSQQDVNFQDFISKEIAMKATSPYGSIPANKKNIQKLKVIFDLIIIENK